MSARVLIPGEPAISLDQAKAHLRVDGTEDDDLIGGLVAAAQGHVEQTFDIATTTQTVEERFDRVGASVGGTRVLLTRRPVRTITSVQTVHDGVSTTVDALNYGIAGDQGFRFVWGATLGQGELVVTYTAGDAPADVPAPIRQALLLLVGHFYAHREAVSAEKGAELPLGVEALLAPYRSWRV